MAASGDDDSGVLDEFAPLMRCGWLNANETLLLIGAHRLETEAVMWFIEASRSVQHVVSEKNLLERLNAHRLAFAQQY